MAQKVNSALKSLINEEDDRDLTVDVTDEVQMKLLSSPVMSSHASSHTQDSSAEALASNTSASTSEGVAEGGVRKEEEREETEAGGRPRAFAREEQEMAIKFSLLPVLGKSPPYIVGERSCSFKVVAF